MLFDEALESISAARGAMQRRQIPEKCALIGKALRIVDEGLKANLNTEMGGELAGNLDHLYSYCAQKLMLANSRNDESLLIEVRDLLETVAQGWRAISPSALAAQAADA
jgi:flagellar protein FliS